MLEKKIEEAQKLIEDRGEADSQIHDKLQRRKKNLERVHWRLKSLSDGGSIWCERIWRIEIEHLQLALRAMDICPGDERTNDLWKQIEALYDLIQYSIKVTPEEENFIKRLHCRMQEALNKLGSSKIQSQARAIDIVEETTDISNQIKSLQYLIQHGSHSSPLEELSDHRKSLHSRVQHGRTSLAKENKLLKVIKRTEKDRENVIANVTSTPMDYNNYRGLKNIMRSKDPKKAVKDQIKVKREQKKEISSELEVNQLKYSLANASRLKGEIAVVTEDIRSMKRELNDIAQEKDFLKLKKRSEEMEVLYNYYLSLLNDAKELAKKKDIEGFEELSQKQVKKFTCQWELRGQDEKLGALLT